jgi:acetyl-CoA C-acetyltransferase
MKIVITAAKRTAIGSFMGSLKNVSAVELGVTTTRAVIAGLEPNDIADVVIGNVLQAGQGMNPARQIALKAGLPHRVAGQTINRVCGSGMQSVISAIQALRSGDGELYLTGGIESMSRAPFLIHGMRAGHRYGGSDLVDSIQKDGLTDAFGDEAMGVTAENVAAKWKISRIDQDAYAVESHRRAAAAWASGTFHDEIIPVEIAGRKGTTIFSQDEHLRPDTSTEVLAKLSPAFKPGGTVTAGNSSGINDGAAMLTLATEDYASSRGLAPIAEIVSYALVGVDPSEMGIGPSSAVPLALSRAGLKIDDIDLFELNEAFAATSLAVMRDLKLSPEKVNVGGGAIALGHPIGASGARVLVTLIHALRRAGKKLGVASLCIGGGMGIAVIVKAR